MTKFSIFLPRIDTRSLPAMAEFADQAEYETACSSHIKEVFADRGIGTPTEVSLLRKYTREMYLFFVAFVHFKDDLAGTPAAERFRTALCEEQQTRVTLPGGFYWLVHPYRERTNTNTSSTLDQQQRLLSAIHPLPMPRPRLVRQNGGRQHQPVTQELGDPHVAGYYTEAFRDWFQTQTPEVQQGYRSAVNLGQTELVSQYHQQAAQSAA